MRPRVRPPFSRSAWVSTPPTNVSKNVNNAHDARTQHARPTTPARTGATTCI